MLFILFNLYDFEKILEEIKINQFNKIKTEVKNKLKNEYFIQIDTNDLNVIDSLKTIKDLKSYLYFLSSKYRIIDYNYILLLKREKEEKKKRYDNGIDEKTGKYIPNSPALKNCYYFSHKFIPYLKPEYYEEKKNDVCIYNNNVFISSYEVNEELANIFINLSESNIFYDTIVIDFIENPGGLLDVSNIIISILTGEKIIIQNFFSRDTIFRISTLVVTNPPLKYKTLIFLSNKNSASASEYIMFKTYEILKNQKDKKIKIINKDNKTIGKKTVQKVENIGITKEYLLFLKDSLLRKNFLKFYYPFITDTTYLIDLFQKELQEFIDLEFVYTIYVIIYYDPLNKEINEKIENIEKNAKYVKEIITFLIYYKL